MLDNSILFYLGWNKPFWCNILTKSCLRALKALCNICGVEHIICLPFYNMNMMVMWISMMLFLTFYLIWPLIFLSIVSWSKIKVSLTTILLCRCILIPDYQMDWIEWLLVSNPSSQQIGKLFIYLPVIKLKLIFISTRRLEFCLTRLFHTNKSSSGTCIQVAEALFIE